MDCCLSYSKPGFSFPSRRFPATLTHSRSSDWRPLIVVACRYNSCDYSGRLEFGGLNTPLEVKSPAGRLLSGIFLNHRENFHVAVREQLEQLADERNEAAARVQLSFGSDEAFLHRRIADLKRNDCQTAVEDIMYVLICYKFSEIGVHLIPRLAECVYNGRLEVWPSKDWELESIHSFEVLEMVREHLTAMVGWRPNSSIADNWALTKIHRPHLSHLYAASVLYGYFLKSALTRHNLEQSLHLTNHGVGMTIPSHVRLSEMKALGSQYISFGCISSPRSTSVGPVSRSLGKKRDKLRSYLMGFDPDTVQMCAKPKSKEGLNLIQRHRSALFGDEGTGLLEADEVISTSFASLKRFLLEAIAFGSFLWDTEDCINTVYKLEDTT